ASPSSSPSPSSSASPSTSVTPIPRTNAPSVTPIPLTPVPTQTLPLTPVPTVAPSVPLTPVPTRTYLTAAAVVGRIGGDRVATLPADEMQAIGVLLELRGCLEALTALPALEFQHVRRALQSGCRVSHLPRNAATTGPKALMALPGSAM